MEGLVALFCPNGEASCREWSKWLHEEASTTESQQAAMLASLAAVQSSHALQQLWYRTSPDSLAPSTSLLDGLEAQLLHGTWAVYELAKVKAAAMRNVSRTIKLRQKRMEHMATHGLSAHVAKGKSSGSGEALMFDGKAVPSESQATPRAEEPEEASLQVELDKLEIFLAAAPRVPIPGLPHPDVIESATLLAALAASQGLRERARRLADVVLEAQMISEPDKAVAGGPTPLSDAWIDMLARRVPVEGSVVTTDSVVATEAAAQYHGLPPGVEEPTIAGED